MFIFNKIVNFSENLSYLITEILTFNEWSLKFTISRSVLSYLRSMELTDVSIEAIVALSKQKQNGV